MTEMTKRERIQAALAGKMVDRMPLAFWRHWPMDDQNAESLARVALDFYHRYDFDFIKIPPSYTYCTTDYGSKHEYRAGTIAGWCFGERDFLERVIKQVEDWDHIEPLDVHQGAYGQQLQSLRMVIERREPDTPVIHTMFNPAAMAQQLAGEETFLVHLRHYPQRVERALAALTETCASFAKVVIAEGADGIFLSTTTASYDVMSEEEYRHFSRPHDLTVLAAAADGWFNVLHLHGQHPMFAQLADYPVHAINWHDRTAGPSLTEASQLFPGALMGGVDQYSVLHFGTPADIKSQIHDAIKQMNGRRLIIAAGCTFPLTVPEGSLITARQAVATATVK